MKKLMVAAAAAALAGSTFAICADPGTGSDDRGPCPAAVYQWQFKGKTAVGVILKGGTTITKGSTCVDGSSSTYCAEAVRVPGTLAITAYTYVCCDECTLFASNILTPAADGSGDQFRLTKPAKTVVYNNTKFIKGLPVANVIGKNANQFEMGGTAEFNVTDPKDMTQIYKLTFAGFGSFDQKNGRPKSVSGNFAGMQTMPKYPGKATIQGATGCVDTWCPVANYWNCGSELKGDKSSVAYGTWSIKYNSAASKKLTANKNWRAL